MSPGFLWNVEGLPVSVLFSPAVLAELRANLDVATPVEGTEFGGILLGTVENEGDHFWTTVVAFEQFPIEHRHGPLYMLSPRDRHQLERRLKRRRRGGLVPVGLCRSHVRRGLYLDQRDFDVFQADFHQPAAVFLLLRRAAAGPPAGAVFIWEENDVRRHASYLEFPIDDVPVPTVSAAPVAEAPAPASWLTPVAEWSNRAGEFARRYAVLPNWSTAAMAKVLVTVALPLFSFYVAREFAFLRSETPAATEPAAVAPAAVAPAAVAPALTDQPAQADPSAPTNQLAPAVDPDVKPSPLRALAEVPAMAPPPAAAPASPAAKRRNFVDSRDRSVPVTVTTPGRDAELPDPPPVELHPAMPASPVLQFSRTTSSPPAASGQAPSKVVAFIKPAPRSGIRHALQKVPVLRDLAGHEQDEGFVPANPVEHPLPAAPPGPAASEKNGSIEMLAKVDRKGNVAVVRVVDGNHNLADASAHALLQWHFEPARQDGAAVDSEMLIRFEFRNPSR